MEDTSINHRNETVHGRHRLWIPSIIAILAGIGIAIVRFMPELERNFKGWLTLAIAVVAFLLAVIWFAFLSGFRWKVRLTFLGLFFLAGFGLSKALRVAGTVNGTGLPSFSWRWTAPRTRSLGLPPPPGLALAGQQTRLPAGLSDAPQFFGPRRDGNATDAKLSRDWDSTPPRELWRHPVGAGWSAFAVVDGLAYTQEQRGEEEAVTCYEALTGRLLWAHANPAHFSQWQGGDGPRATPSVRGGRVYAIGATGILDCLDARTGNSFWSRDVLKENHLENLTWGVSGSPLVFDDTVVVTGGQTNGLSLLAFRCATGEPLWKSGADRASYASPILATIAGQKTIVAVNAASLTIHDPETGAVLLDYPFSDGKMPKAAQPVLLSGDRLFLSSGYGVGCVLLHVTAGPNDQLNAAQLWKNLRMKTQFNSAAVRGDFIYGLDDGSLACVEVATGVRKWKGGHYGSGQSLLVDDLVLIQSEAGAVLLADAKPDGFRELGKLPALNAKTWNYPTLAGRYLLVRNSEEAACYELPEAR